MWGGEIVVNQHPEKKRLETVSGSGTFAQRLTEEKCPYSRRMHVLVKDDSFTSTSTDSVGDDRPPRMQSCCGLLCMSLALVACGFGCYVMWGTDFFTLLVHQNLVITNNSKRYETWKSPPVHAFLRVYIFNYTNVREFEEGTDIKLNVTELGPFTYIEKLERVDVRFNENGTATYRDKKTYKFSPAHSRGNESDVILVPNIPFLAIVSYLSELNPFFRKAVTSFLKSIGGRPFISLTVEEFLWGYEDSFVILAQKALSFKYNLPFKKIGILSAKNQTQRDLVTIYTGEDDPSKIGVVSSYNGKTSLDYWNSKECNRIDGTDGTVYPPSLVRPNSTLYVYLKDLCRKLPLVYGEEYLDKHGIPVLSFHLPPDVFASGLEREDNLCFCGHTAYGSKCLPSGLFNVGPCAYEAPVAVSLPHFLYGDSVLFRGIEGLQPSVRRHETYVEVDPKMGIPVGGKSRLQLNILLSGEFGNSFKNSFYKNQLLLPMTWMDYGVDCLPEDISAMIRSLLSFIKVAEFALSYGFVISFVVLGLFLVSRCHHAWRRCCRMSGGETPLVVLHEKK